MIFKWSGNFEVDSLFNKKKNVTQNLRVKNVSKITAMEFKEVYIASFYKNVHFP